MADNTYIIYVRKSSESEDRQVLSIDAQVAELKNLAQRRGLVIADILTEARSAKSPGRPVFDELAAKIAKRTVTGILCWKLDRLARNPVDGGSIIWAMKQHGLQVETPTQSYSDNTDNVMMMYIEFGMAHKYIDDLSRNVKRGNRFKLDRGELPGPAPQGYLNDLANHTIIPDPDRFLLIKRAWGLMLTGNHSVPKIVRMANEDWGYRTRKTKRQGDHKMPPSSLYKIFSNPFYYGLIVRNVEGTRKEFQGSHEPMITNAEFDQVQKLLGRDNRPRPQKHVFAYTGLMACGGCGASITAEEHWKKDKQYVYYHCTRKMGPCKQPYIPQPKLEEQIQNTLNTITISNGFREWALKHLRKTNNQETKVRTRMYQSQQTAYNSCQKQLDTLLSMRVRELISDEEYLQKRNELQGELESLKLKLADTEDRAANWFELAEKTLIFANKAKESFDNGTDEERREIFAALGSNFILKDKTISIKLQKPLALLQNTNPHHQKAHQKPDSFSDGSPQSTKFELLVEMIGEFFRDGANQAIHIPNLKPCV